MELLADTTFLIDLWREVGTPGPATSFGRAYASAQTAIPWVVAGEFLSGAAAANQDSELVRAFLSRYPVLHSDAATVRSYAAIYADLRKRSRLIGPNDLWIAACAVANDLPILTRNVAEFGRVSGLQVIDYKAGNGESPVGR